MITLQNEAPLQPDELQRDHERLTALMNADPAGAIAAARALQDDDAKCQQLRAAVLGDAGAAAGDIAAVEEAIVIFSRLHERFSNNGGLAYNLANTLGARAQLDRTQAPDWYLQTSHLRRRARALYAHAAAALEQDDPALASQALTNLANALDAANRWIEAYECYQAALATYPQNGVASGCAAEVLFRISSEEILGHRPHLMDLALRLAHHAKRNRKTVVRFAGPQAAETFERLESRAAKLATRDLGKKPSPYERFVAENRLLLSPIVEGLGHNRRRWDDAHIAGVTRPASAGPRVPPIFAMFNVMKADYLVARELLFRGLHEPGGAADTGLYFDTLDYAAYGVTQSQLVLAQRAALDLLDKIAVALNEHLSVGENPKHVNFHGFWGQKPNEPRWKPALAKVIQEGNPALIALSEIAADLSDASQQGMLPGFLNEEKRARHAGTHRFLILHDIAMGDLQPTAAIEHHMLGDFKGTALRTVRLARAALLHFLEAVAYVERPRAHGSAVVPIAVHPHHVIRGRK